MACGKERCRWSREKIKQDEVWRTDDEDGEGKRKNKMKSGDRKDEEKVV